jgi:hypothetical protein
MLAYKVSACSLVYTQNKGGRFVSIRSCNNSIIWWIQQLPRSF